MPCYTYTRPSISRWGLTFHFGHAFLISGFISVLVARVNTSWYLPGACWWLMAQSMSSKRKPQWLHPCFMQKKTKLICYPSPDLGLRLGLCNRVIRCLWPICPWSKFSLVVRNSYKVASKSARLVHISSTINVRKSWFNRHFFHLWPDATQTTHLQEVNVNTCKNWIDRMLALAWLAQRLQTGQICPVSRVQPMSPFLFWLF